MKKKEKIKVISLFSGGGGLDYGFKKAGYEIIWAIDNNKNAVSTYKENIGDNIICGDINKINIKEIPKADIIIGGPPCQSFSLAGNRHTEDSRGQLVWQYLKIINEVKPKAFLFENVTGLLSAKNSKGELIIDCLINNFIKLGYDVNYKVINAADYGVPQRRQRVIIVGLRDGKRFEFPKVTHSEDGIKLKKYVSVEDALGDLPYLTNKTNSKNYRFEPRNKYQKLMQCNGELTEHIMPKMSELDLFIVNNVKPGGNYMDIPSTVKSKRIRRLQKEGGGIRLVMVDCLVRNPHIQ